MTTATTTMAEFHAGRAQQPAHRYSLLYVTGWDQELNEPTGGRVVGGYASLRQCLAERKVMQEGRAAVRLLWGEGHLVVTRRDGTPLLAPPELRVRCEDRGEDVAAL